MGLGASLRLALGFCCFWSALASSSALTPVPALGPQNAIASANGTGVASGKSTVLTLVARFLDGVPVPLADAQLTSGNDTQSNQTLGDGSCSFLIDPSLTYSLQLSAQGSRMTGGPITLMRPLTIGPSAMRSYDGVRDLGNVTVQFYSFCSGTVTVASNNGGILGGSQGAHALQTPNQTCTWVVGPFSDPGTIVLSLQWLDLTSGDSITVYANDPYNNVPPKVLLQMGTQFPNLFPGLTTLQVVSVYTSQAIIVFNTGQGADSLTYGFLLYYRVDRFITTARVLALSLIWVGGGFVFLFVLFLIVAILKRRRRRLLAGRIPRLLPWDRLQGTPSAEPDADDHDVMVVKLPGEEPQRLALPHKVWEPSVDKARSLNGTGQANGPDELGSVSAAGKAIPSSANAVILQTTVPPGPLFDGSLPAGMDIELQSTATKSGSQAGPLDGPHPTAQDAPSNSGRAVSIGPKEVSVMQRALDLLSKRKTASSLPAVSEAVDLGREASEDPEACAICLADYEEGAVLRPLPCEHAFHTACIDTWLKKDPSCPLCKRPLCTPPTRCKSTAETSQQQGGSSTIVEASTRSPSNNRSADLETGVGLEQARESIEVEERADRNGRQHAMNPVWYLNQWLGWGL